MDQLRFDAGLGIYTVNVAPESIGIFKGMGTHYLRLQLEVGISEVGPEAGQLLSLETTLYAPHGSGPRVPLAMRTGPSPSNPPARFVEKRSNTSS